MISPQTEAALLAMDVAIGEGWYRHALAADATDDLLHVIIADGVFTTKIDGWIHAATMTTPFLLRYAREDAAGLELARLTSWEARNSAVRYAHWQVDFHWKIDTRNWQYLLYLKFMRRSYTDAIRALDVPPAQVDELLRINDQFWDEVEIAYSYRMELLERSRGFAPHPDPTAGAANHGYVYRTLVDTPDYDFSELQFELIGAELGAGTAATTRVPRGWPNLSETAVSTELAAARRWLDDVRSAGLADEWLRVRLGERWVPTRVNGWEAGLAESTTFLLGETELGLAAVSPATSPQDRARLYAAVQSEFWHRLDGDPEQLAVLLASQRAALVQMHPRLAPELIETFLGLAVACIRNTSASAQTGSAPVDPATLDELTAVTRPLHPRYAAFDPVEPLPWQTRNPQRHLARMRRLGYTV